MFVFILFISSKIIFINNKSKNLIKNYAFYLLIILASFTYISLMTKLFISDTITIKLFYLGNLIVIFLTATILGKKNGYL